MKIAYLILVHQLPEQLTRLIRRLAISETDFFIHVSKNTDDTQYDKMVEGVRGLPNVVFLLLVPKRKFVKGFKPYGGSSWWCLTRECLTYIHGFIKENPDFFDYFKYVNLSEEIFFQTLILNSPFKDSVVNDDLRCIDWSDGRWQVKSWYRFPFEQGQTRVWRSGPRISRKEHFEILKNSKGLIARKFDTRIDSEILDLIDHELLSA